MIDDIDWSDSMCVIVLTDDLYDEVIKMTLAREKGENREDFQTRIKETCEGLYQTFGIVADLYSREEYNAQAKLTTR